MVDFKKVKLIQEGISHGKKDFKTVTKEKKGLCWSSSACKHLRLKTDAKFHVKFQIGDRN